jgi:quinol monooxygenase YgiN
MYGLIAKMTASPGQRDSLTAILMDELTGRQGCLSYIVAHDPADEHAVWVTEVWTDEATHRASVREPAVKAIIARCIDKMATFSDAQVTRPLGGTGL